MDTESSLARDAIERYAEAGARDDFDGMEALRKLRGHDATRVIPIVVFSSQYTQFDVLMSYRAGANSFVDKPTDFAGLTEFFRECLNYWMPRH